MAILKAFAVFDVKAETFNAPFFTGTRGQAVRMFADGVNDDATMLGRHPEDFKLVEVGFFDDHKGELVQLEHTSLGFGVEYKRAGGQVVGIKEG